MGFIEVIWLGFGIFSLAVLCYFIFKKSSLEQIPLHMIDGFKVKEFLGKDRFFIQLKNGKTRELLEIKTQAAFMELKDMYASKWIAQ